MSSSRLLLVDALGLAYRAFHAIPSLTAADGRPTNALFGFIKTWMQVERVWTPSHACVVFDGGTPPERLELLSAYKAQRPAMPDLLRAQLPAIGDYLDCAGVAHLRLEAQEADDVLASLVARARDGMEVLLLTADKDLMQLVNTRVGLLTPGKTEDRIGPSEVLAKTGVRPEQIVEWLALIGDSADNIPGVPGVGPKTAAKWLTEWHTLAQLWEHLDQIKPDRLRGLLAEHRVTVERNVRLMRLRTDLPCPPSLEAVRRRPPDPERLRRFYETMGFHSLARPLAEPTLL